MKNLYPAAKTTSSMILFGLAFGLGLSDAGSAVLTRNANQYNGSYHVIDPAMLPLTGTPPSLDGVRGYFEYTVTIDTTGWYELRVGWNTSLGDYQNGTTGIFYPYTKYFIHNPNVGMTYFNSSIPTSAASGLPSGVFKPGVVWLANDGGSPKSYGVRIENYYNVMPLPPITSFELRKLAPNFATNLRVTCNGDGSWIGRRYVGLNENLPINIQAGGDNLAGTVIVEVWKEGASSATSSVSVPFSATANPVTTATHVSVSATGDYYLKYKVGSSYVPTHVNLPRLSFTALNIAAATAPSNSTISKTAMITEINCATTSPTYSGGLTDSVIPAAFNNGNSRVVTVGGLTYRETANNGFSDCWLANRQPASGQYITWANWFAYTMPATLQKGQLYLMEIDYPDNDDRSFLMEVRQGGVKPYQIRASGVDTGGYHTPTNTMKTHQIFFWPDNVADQPRAVVLNYQIGMRAAAAKIRLYRVNGELPWLLGNSAGGGRKFGHWFEEPFSFTMTYSDGSVKDSGSYALAIERWAKMLKYLGGDTLWVNVSIYGDLLYPSNNYQKQWAAPNTPDYFKMILLIAKKYDLKVVAEFHPRSSSELLTKYRTAADPNNYPHLAVKKDGSVVNTTSTALFNPVYPANQTWLTGMLREFVLKYKTEPSFHGISLRGMDWVNPGLNNFSNIDWGYDAETAQLFAANGGPAYDSSLTPAQRYALFTSSTYSVQWDAFRVDQINTLYSDLRDTLITDANVRPNSEFTIYSNTGVKGIVGSVTPTVRPDRIKAGVADANISGFKYVGRFSYGRHRSVPSAWDSDRLSLTDPNELLEFASSRSFFATAAYAEDSGWTVPNSWLGLPDFTGASGNPWVSGHLVPTGRYNQERYALMLARGDATLIMNGGNNYFIDQESTREFLKEYRQLPNHAFTAINSTTADPVVIRQYLVGGLTNMFYLVNTTNTSRRVRINFSNTCQLQRLSSGGTTTPGTTWDINPLAPFEVRVYRVNDPATITAWSNLP